MSDERMKKQGASNGMSDADKGYYEELYTDLPKEVVDILMQTHPLAGKNEKDAESSAYRSRRPHSREDVEEVREARRQQVNQEIDEVKMAPQQEGDPTLYVSRRARGTGSDAQEVYAREEEYDDGIQYVSMMPAKRKSRIVEEVTIQTTAAPSKWTKKIKRDDDIQMFDHMGKNPKDNRPRYEDVDFEKKAKQEHLNKLYDEYDEYDDYDEGSGRGKQILLLGAIGLVVIIFLIFRTVSLDSKLEETQNLLSQSEEYKQKYEDVQLEKMQLEEQLDALLNPTEPVEETEADGSEAEGESDGAGREYIVQQGDTLWMIAQREMGNGVDYEKILAANGMKEGDSLRVGTKIMIPVAE